MIALIVKHIKERFCNSKMLDKLIVVFLIALLAFQHHLLDSFQHHLIEKHVSSLGCASLAIVQYEPQCTFGETMAQTAFFRAILKFCTTNKIFEVDFIYLQVHMRLKWFATNLKILIQN